MFDVVILLLNVPIVGTIITTHQTILNTQLSHLYYMLLDTVGIPLYTACFKII